MRPELSFVIPAYNAAEFVSATIDSILAQEVASTFEIVVVDDASTDGTPAILNNYEERLPDVVRVFRNDENRGGGASRNRAVNEARAEQLYVVDSDNILPDGTAKAILDHRRDTGLDACSVERLKFFQGAPSEIKQEYVLAQTEGRSGLRHMFEGSNVPGAHGNYLYTRELFDAVGGYEENRGAMDAWTFGFKHTLRGFDVAIAPGTFYNHRVGRADSFWTLDEKRGVNDLNAIGVIKEHIEELPPDLAAKVEALNDGDRIFRYIEAGLFREQTSEVAFVAELERRRSEPDPASGPVRERARAIARRVPGVAAAVRSVRGFAGR